jgi:iron complex outermembrane receptor protein
VAAFLDGALLNVPWDNRVDLSLVPASMIAGVSVVQGVPPVEYGTNVLGGAVNLTSPSWTDSRTRVDAALAGGSENQRHGTLAARGVVGRWLWGLSAGYAARDGLPLAGGASLAFSQPDPGLRTNTDSRIANVAGRMVHQSAGGTEVGLSLFHLDAEKGVAPEGHKDPAVSSVRFWRYPDWHNTMGILSGRGMLGSNLVWKGAAWASRFHQAIDSYTSAGYDSLEAREEDNDYTIGGRLTGQLGVGRSAFKLAMNALTSRHKQLDLSLQPDGQPAVGPLPAQLVYQQVVLSTGAEYEFDPIDRLDLTVGASLDAMLAPKTGDKPSLDAFTDYSVTTGAGFRVDGGWFLRLGAGRKSRFPTMRELFGEALNRFLLNPDLKPESSVLTEAALELRRSKLRAAIIPFGAFTSNTIDQQSVLVAGETRPRRQRVNLRGSRVLGVEMSSTISPGPDVSISGHFTLSQVRRLQDSTSDPIYLSERPATLGRLAAGYTPSAGPTGSIEAVYTGRAYSLDDNNQFVPLPASLALNVRAGYRVALAADREMEVYVRVDNATDALVVPQLGLPDAGRSAQAGIKASF